MTWDDEDFDSPDPLIRFNAHQAAKGRPQLPDPDVVRKAAVEAGVREACGRVDADVSVDVARDVRGRDD